MAIQTINLGVAPSGAGGDTFRSTGAKINENFANWNHAASRYVGVNAGNVMEVGAFGLGKVMGEDNSALRKESTGFHNIGAVNSTDTSGQPKNFAGVSIVWHNNQDAQVQFGANVEGAVPIFGFRRWVVSNWGTFYKLYGTHNTTVDPNGFIKNASPIVSLYADKIECNDEAKQQKITFEKLGVGDYLVKGSLGFAQEGWYIEMPKDANGNVLVAVQYAQLEDKTIEVRTFAKKFDEETGDIVPNLEKPRDIPSGRWIDIRLKALPQPEIEISKTPADFQPTNLAQAVAEALKNDAEQ